MNNGSKILSRPSLRRLFSVLTLMLIDALALLTGLVLADYLAGSKREVLEILYFAPVLLAVWLAIFAAHDLYDRAQKRRNPLALLGAILWGVMLVTIGSLIYSQSRFSLEEILLGIFFIILLNVGLRLLYEQAIKSIYRRRLGLIPTLIIGGEEERARVRQMMQKTPSAYICKEELDVNGRGADLALLRQALDQTGAQNVILTGTQHLSDLQFLDLMRSMWLRRVKVQVVPEATTLMTNVTTISQDIGIPLLEVNYPRLDDTQWALKRILDVAGSLGGLIVLSPLLVGVAVLIRLTSPGPVFFKQKRVGADEKVFTCYKFRSMRADAETRQASLEARNEADGVLFKIKSDPRVTPIGRFIRRWSIDELPQLINILKGEMSLVGPRPLPLRDFQRMSELHKKRLATIPGLTGYWQISGRSNLSFEDMVRLDLYYIENWSLSMDIEIILKTIRAVLRREGSY